MRHIFLSALTMPIIFLALGSYSISQPILAQTVDNQRSCDSSASDPDGDGFGWEWDYDATRYSSCIVTEESRTIPVRFDWVTGNPIPLVRPYWNANRDIAGRDIACERLDYLSNPARIEGSGDIWHFSHDPLPLTFPFIASASFTGDTSWRYELSERGFSVLELWTVVNGSYRGPMASTEWLQIVDRDGQPNSAVRTSGGKYECFDTSGRAFVPTGSVEEVLPEPQSVDLPTIPVTGYDNSELINGEPIINMETGNEVEFELAVWDLYSDIVGRQSNCISYAWVEQSQAYIANSPWYATTFYPIYNTQSLLTGRYTDSESSEPYVEQGQWTVVDGQIDLLGFNGDFFGAKYVEIVDVENGFSREGNKIRTWFDSFGYSTCIIGGKVVGVGLVDRSVGTGIAPTGVLEDTPVVDAPPTETVGESDASSVATDTATPVSSDTSLDSDSSATIAGSDLPAAQTSSGGGVLGFGLLYLLFISIAVRTYSNRR